MPVVPLIYRVVTHATSLCFLQSKIPLLARFVGKFFGRPVGDVLHVNRVVVAGVRREQAVIAV